jgi:hypothetical protein
VTDDERNRGPWDALEPAQWAVVIVLGIVAISMLLAPGQWLVEQSGLSPVLGIALVLGIETVAALGIAAAVLWGSDTTRSTFEEEWRH